jgi:cytochrome d ubiquinol oxidase subunit II
LRALNRGKGHAPFIWSLLIFISSFAGLAASLYPYLLPPSLALDASAASSATLLFMLVGIGMLMPVMLIYNGYQYLVFRDTIK